MPTRALGDSGISASVVGLGTNNFGWRVRELRDVEAVVDAALDAGVTFFDTADVYGGHGGSEERLGELLAANGRRARVTLATKFGKPMGDDGGPRGAHDYVIGAVEASLRRLRTDVIDYLWMHEPDERTPVAETLAALQELIDAGKVRAIGCSQYSAAQIREADAVARDEGLSPFTAIQDEYNLLAREEAETVRLPLCRELGLGFVPYFPLAAGLLTGKYRAGEAAPEGARLTDSNRTGTDAQLALVAALQAYADAREVPLTTVAIGALLTAEPVVSVIAGATTPGQVRGNATAAGWIPSDPDLAELRAILETHPVS